MKRTSRRSLLILLVILFTIFIHFLIFLFLFVPLRVLFINPVLEKKLDEIHHKLHPQPPVPPQTPWVNVNPPQGAPVMMVDADDTDDEPLDAARVPPVNTAAASISQESEMQEASPQEESTIQYTPEPEAVIANPSPDPDYIPPSLFKPKPVAQASRADIPDIPAPAPMQKKRMTLAKLADGFITDQTEARTVSSLSLTMLGAQSNSVKMTEQQLKEGRFLEKIAHALISAWHAQAATCPIHAPPAVDIHLQFIITAQGEIKDVSITKSSNILIVDTFITKVIRSAGTGMPPIPTFLRASEYPVRLILDGINPHRGPQRLVARQI